MAEETATAAPARTRAARKTTSTSAPRKTTGRAKAAPAVQKGQEDGREVYVFDLVADGETKTYAKFKPPVGSACVGTFYAPLGTTSVKVKMTGGPVE